MKNKMSILIAGLLVALLVVGVVGATNAYAQSSSGTLPHGRGPGGGGGGRGLGLEGLQAAAQALNMTTDELINALRSGSTLEELAEEAGVDLQDVQDAIQEARTAAMRERIQQAVDDGTITQEHADWLLEGLEKGFLGGHGGFGLGGPKGPGLDPAPGQTPAVEPTQTSG